MKLLDIALYTALPALVLLHLVVAPYTKVEESFNIQAVHDLLVYGTPSGAGAAARLAARYDHFVFSGAVPRTFVGAVLLAGLAQPFVVLGEWLGGPVSGIAAQVLVRAVLGLANAGALAVLARALGRCTGGRSVTRWFLALQLSQFHVIFYASRTLPNMFAFFLTTLAFAFLLEAATPPAPAGLPLVSLGLLATAAVVFRAEVVLLLAAMAGYVIAVPAVAARGSVPGPAAVGLVLTWRIARSVLFSVTVALLLSLPVDAYFWQGSQADFWGDAAAAPGRLLRLVRLCPWPELHGFLFNVLQGQASQWGVSSWHYYATSALPRLLLNPLALPLIAWALYRRPSRAAARLLVLPSLAFVALYSLQPHKETRFVLYVAPPLTAAAALGADQLLRVVATGAEKHKKKKTEDSLAPLLLPRLCLALLALSILLAFAASTGMLLLSALNYPGGEALAALRRWAVETVETAGPAPSASSASRLSSHVVVAHADVLACMTGVTLFGSTLGSALDIPWLPSTSALWAADKEAAAFQPLALSSSSPPVQLILDRTEDPAQLRDPAFWARFDYVLAEVPPQQTAEDERDMTQRQPPSYHFDPSQWRPVAVVHGFAGVEVLHPGQAAAGEDDKVRREAPEADQEGQAQGQARPLLVGHGATVAQVRQLVRRWTGGWWVGPRMVPRLQILQQIHEGQGKEHWR